MPAFTAECVSKSCLSRLLPRLGKALGRLGLHPLCISKGKVVPASHCKGGWGSAYSLCFKGHNCYVVLRTLFLLTKTPLALSFAVRETFTRNKL